MDASGVLNHLPGAAGLGAYPAAARVGGGRFGCVDWAQDPGFLLCTHQTLASKR